MHLEVTAPQIRLAHAPHNLFIAGIFLFDLLMPPAVIVLKLGMAGIFVPLLCSGTLIVYIYRRSRQSTDWFADMHWKLSWQRGRLLLIGYGISGVLILIAWLVSQMAGAPSMAQIMWTAMTRIALVPTLIFVMVTAVLEASAIGQASNGEVPDNLAARFPPPAA